MLHKHPSAEKAQDYFGVTEKVKLDAANFFIWVQPKIGLIYDHAARKAFDEDFNFQDIRTTHISHISRLLTGEIDHTFIDEAHKVYACYLSHGITTGEYIKLYQLIISHLNGEAHKKHWLGYKKYRDLNRAIRNLLLFDLAISTSFKDQPSFSSLITQKHSIEKKNVKIHIHNIGQLSEELATVITIVDEVLQECYATIQSITETPFAMNCSHISNSNLRDFIDSPLLELKTEHQNSQTFLLISQTIHSFNKSASNSNFPLLVETLKTTQKKLKQLFTLISNNYLWLDKNTDIR